MDETSHEPMKVWRFLRRQFVRIVIGAVLAVAVYGMLSTYVTYQRERRISKEIRAFGLIVDHQSDGPDWIPQSVQPHLPFLSRILAIKSSLSERHSMTRLDSLHSQDAQVTDAALEHLKGLAQLEFLNLNNTQVTDVGLEHLSGLGNLKELYLSKTQITDAGLEHLKRLTKLTDLGLGTTQVTGPGLEHLKRLINLKTLYLNNTEVADTDLKHLKGLTALTFLNLDRTQTSANGRATLRQALPNCRFEPNP